MYKSATESQDKVKQVQYMYMYVHLVDVPSEDTRGQAIVCGIGSSQYSINITVRREEGKEGERMSW